MITSMQVIVHIVSLFDTTGWVTGRAPELYKYCTRNPQKSSLRNISAVISKMISKQSGYTNSDAAEK